MEKRDKGSEKKSQKQTGKKRVAKLSEKMEASALTEQMRQDASVVEKSLEGYGEKHSGKERVMGEAYEFGVDNDEFFYKPESFERTEVGGTAYYACEDSGQVIYLTCDQVRVEGFGLIIPTWLAELKNLA